MYKDYDNTRIGDYMKLRKILSLLFMATVATGLAACDKTEETEKTTYPTYAGVENRYLTVEDIRDVRRLSLGLGKDLTDEQRKAQRAEALNKSPEEGAAYSYIIYIYHHDCYWCKEMKEDAFTYMKDYDFKDVYFLNTNELNKEATFMTYEYDDSNLEANPHTKQRRRANITELLKWTNMGDNTFVQDSISLDSFGTPTVLRFEWNKKYNEANGYMSFIGAGVGGGDSTDKTSSRNALFYIKEFSCSEFKDPVTSVIITRATQETCKKK